MLPIWLGTLGPAGPKQIVATAQRPIALPPGLPTGPVADIQALVAQPFGPPPYGSMLTAAFYVSK